LSHIDQKASLIKQTLKEHRVPICEQAERLFNICSYLNWLAHIDLREEYHYIRESGYPEGKAYSHGGFENCRLAERDLRSILVLC
jgi:hypothetical protein